MDDQLINELSNCRDLPSIPSAAVSILELAQSETASLSDVAQSVKVDPALTLKILRIANSPIYGGRRESENLAQALSLLGLDATLTLALSFSLVNSLKNTNAEGFDLDAYWRRCLLAAAASQTIAKKYPAVVSEDCFVASLLQDIGQLALVGIRPDFYADLSLSNQRSHSEIAAFEKQHLNADHVDVGMWLLEQWKIPDRLTALIQHSHTDMSRTEEAETEYNLDAQIVNFSSLIAETLTENPSLEVWTAISNHSLTLSMGGQSWIQELIPLLSEQVPVVEEMFEMSLLGGRTVESLLADARELELMRNLQKTKKLEQTLQSTETLQQRIAEVEKLSQLDSLTGLYNRGFLDLKLQEGFDQAVECSWPYSVVFIDIDHFKRINDSSGHDVGDYVLQKAAQLMVDTTRDTDIVGRYGGEEFLIILPGLNKAKAHRVGERLVDAFRETVFSYDNDRQFKLTISAGIATYDERSLFTHKDLLVRAADTAMYRAKESGRNMFFAAEK